MVIVAKFKNAMFRLSFLTVSSSWATDKQHCMRFSWVRCASDGAAVGVLPHCRHDRFIFGLHRKNGNTISLSAQDSGYVHSQRVKCVVFGSKVRVRSHWACARTRHSSIKQKNRFSIYYLCQSVIFQHILPETVVGWEIFVGLSMICL